jgi:aminoglycoside phosphotransferase (APT) family kinase protein
LESWLAARLGVAAVTVSDISLPKAGFSNETIFGTALWEDEHDERQERGFVLRIQPSGHQLFVEPDAMRQARVMEQLAGHLPVPAVWLTEPDPRVLGAPFFLMDRVGGRIPSDIPSWHEAGWTTELTPEQRGRLYDSGLAALAALHGADWRGGLAFLDPPGEGTALDRYIAHLQRWYQWCEPVRRFGADVIEAAFDHVVRHRPATDAAVISWGDARPGNIIFGDDLSVVALLDWEGATIGPPEIDVGWWLMFEEFLCEAQGLTRLEGVPDRDATIARYQELSGRPVEEIRYYEILAGLVLALINSRLADLMIAGGRLEPAVAGEFVTRVTDMTARWLGDP